MWPNLAGGEVNPVKNYPSSSLITLQNLVGVCHTEWEYVDDLKKWGWSPALWATCRAWPSRVTHLPHTLPNVAAVGQTVWAYIWGPKNLGTLEFRPLSWTWLTPWRRFYPRVTVPNLVVHSFYPRESVTGHSVLFHDFDKYWQIFKILSPSDSPVIV